MVTGEIDLEKIKATYEIEDMHLVDRRKLESANETRLYFEISFALGLAFLGAELQEHNKWLLIATSGFLLFGLFFLIRFIIKMKGLKPKGGNKKEEIDPFKDFFQEPTKK